MDEKIFLTPLPENPHLRNVRKDANYIQGQRQPLKKKLQKNGTCTRLAEKPHLTLKVEHAPPSHVHVRTGGKRPFLKTMRRTFTYPHPYIILSLEYKNKILLREITGKF